ncbi:hypothetical protein T265_06172 [Opisthorchis viverrini]|uniref:Uncharacterized protein n=1 Tax=Opisthorchis viverrini TaxID=6198 RepID=A0A074ZHA5_OPIVI|nr:hypothetical protein T265_06172 [Opisthorchis viverrini]KER26598.1 hypothetical protein T265_06172 [Opisthorchis viverrini]
MAHSSDTFSSSHIVPISFVRWATRGFPPSLKRAGYRPSGLGVFSRFGTVHHQRQHDISVQHQCFTVAHQYGYFIPYFFFRSAIKVYIPFARMHYLHRLCCRRPAELLFEVRTIRVLNQSLWLKSLTARQRCLAGKCECITISTEQVATCSNPQPGGPGDRCERLCECRGTLSSIAQWIAEVRKPSHHGKAQSLRDTGQQLLPSQLELIEKDVHSREVCTAEVSNSRLRFGIPGPIADEMKCQHTVGTVS